MGLEIQKQLSIILAIDHAFIVCEKSFLIVPLDNPLPLENENLSPHSDFLCLLLES